jgi:hypothetical protein
MIGRTLRRFANLAFRLVRRTRYEVARFIMPGTAVLGPKIVPRVGGPLAEKRDIKLNLGCGPMHLGDYINIDGDTRACADFYMDFDELGDAFASDSVKEILMIHSLSYLNLWQARNFFRVAYRLLRRGGELVIELPSIEKCATHLLASQGDLPAYLEGVRGIYAFDMTEISNQIPFTPYSFGWSAWHLEQELRVAGFDRFVIADPHFHDQPWRDFRIEATKC